MTAAMNYQGKNVAVLGMGRSGEAAALLLSSCLGARVTVLDSASPEALGAAKIEKLGGMGLSVRTGREADTDAAPYDLAVLSPGIDPKTTLVQNFLGRGVPVIAEIEMAFRHSSTPVIGITGTNGKTTTTELVAAMLTDAGIRTDAGGNIGKPYSEIVAEGKPLDIITLEISSFQLERIETFRPAISVWLNLTPDHLDRYDNEKEYRDAKLRIFENQTADDWAIVNFRDALPDCPAKRITFSAYADGADLHLRDEVIHYKDQPVLDPRETNLRGRHNTENLMAALGVGLASGLTPAQMTPSLRAYRPQPHRCELVRHLDGVDYVNDSKATNLDALEKALVSDARPVILIAGGKDKGFPFHTLTDLVGERARWVVLIGEMAERIAADWGTRVPCERAASLEEAVRIAWSLARPGEIVLFSPGTSSFDMFKSYADRGNQFRALVQALRSESST
jgi:UDP-N-acetylmuramoylalanine--D-glutamate ligase